MNEADKKSLRKRAEKHLNFVDTIVSEKFTEDRLRVTYLYKGKTRTASFPMKGSKRIWS